MTLPRALPLLLLLATACADRHETAGLALKVDRDSGTLTVSHDAIPNFMDAMVMPFTVAHPDELNDVRPGDRVAFRINVRKDRTEIDRVRILSAAPTDSGAILSPAQPTLAAIGEPLPDFTLTNQHGQPVSLHALRGKVIAVGFIYTRCPLPDYCPRVITNLAALRDRFRDRLDDDLVLLTVTFDPKHDTAEQLKAYAARHGADVPGWHFLTGSAEEIARVCAMFGVEYWAEEGLLTHTLQTAVLDREGRLAAAAEGKDFTPRQLGDLVELTLNPGR